MDCEKYNFSVFCFDGLLLIDKQRGLAVTSVTVIKTAARLNQHIIEVIGHLGLRISIDKPHEFSIMTLNAIRLVAFTTQEPKEEMSKNKKMQ